MKSLARFILNLLGSMVALPAIFWGFLGLRVFRTERLYQDAAFAICTIAGPVGVAVRRAYYRALLLESRWDLGIEFGSVITHASARVGRNVFIGAYTLIGRCRIGDNARIGSRVSLLSGRRQHRFTDASMEAFEESMSFEEITIGRDVWIGEGSVIMASLGDSVGVGAGSVVVKAVESGVIVAGNPARPIGTRTPVSPGTGS